MKKIVHVVGTGTIGEPLIGLFADFGRHLGVDEVTFHKRTPMTTERAKVNHLIDRGARVLDIGSIFDCAELIVRSALLRHESRGLHFSRDYPRTLPVSFPTVLIAERSRR